MDDSIDLTSTIDLSDVLSMLKDIIGLRSLDGSAYQAGDIDNNGAIDLSDVLSALKHIIGLRQLTNIEITKQDGSQITNTAELITAGRNYFGVSDQKIQSLENASSTASITTETPLNLVLAGDVDFSGQYVENKTDIVSENDDIKNLTFETQAMDVDLGDTITYSLSGPDANYFQLETR